MPDYAPFSDDTVVYIALRNTSYMNMESGDIKPNAFLLREVDLGPANGISLIVCDNPPRIEDLVTLAPRLKSKVCSIDALTVGDIRNLGYGLDVVRDLNTTPTSKGCLTLSGRQSGGQKGSNLIRVVGSALSIVLIAFRISLSITPLLTSPKPGGIIASVQARVAKWYTRNVEVVMGATL